jgi:histidyl-tRNA synthetase
MPYGFHVLKVYKPAIARGRFREFYQCDFDIAGVFEQAIPDAEILCIIVEVFKALDIDIIIKMNHRRILDGMFTVCGVSAGKLRSISSAVDKLDKAPWGEVRKEMIEEKGLSEEVADRIGEYVQRKGSIREIAAFLQSDHVVQDENVKAGLEDIGLISSYTEAYDIADKISFDLSLVSKIAASKSELNSQRREDSTTTPGNMIPKKFIQTNTFQSNLRSHPNISKTRRQRQAQETKRKG